MKLSETLFPPPARRKNAPDRRDRSDRSLRSVRSAAASPDPRRRSLLLVLSVLLFAGLLWGGSAHELWHHDHDEGGACSTCELIAFEPPPEPGPPCRLIALALADAPIIDEPASRVDRSRVRARAPPIAS